jgi:septin family protein
LACGPLKKQRYINNKIEEELKDFKKEIEGKFKKSEIRTFTMPRISEPEYREDVETLKYGLRVPRNILA